MSAGEARILTTHVGSLVRPPGFAMQLRERQAGRLADADYEKALRSAVQQVVQEQVEAGVDVVSDGEYGKMLGWEQYALERMEGFGPRQELQMHTGGSAMFSDMQQFPDFYEEYWKHQELSEGIYPCIGPIRYTGHNALQRDIETLKEAMKRAGAKHGFLPVAAPASAFALSPNAYYKTDEEYVFAGAEALREEYLAIVNAGLYVQVDDAHLPFMYDRIVPPGTDEDFRRWAQVRIDALNHALRGIPEDRVRYHICWGSWNGPHCCDVPLGSMAGLILQVHSGAYAIESANARHEHEWKVWKTAKLPSHRKLIPGVVSHQTNVVEHPELVAERLVRFAGVVGRENLLAGTDCGFAQGPFVQRVHPSIQWAKLRSLAEGARLASRELWP